MVDALEVMRQYMNTEPGYSLDASAIEIAGRSYDVASISEKEIEDLGYALDRICEGTHPMIRREILRASPLVLNVLRAVDKETAQGYGGYEAEGKQLFVYLMNGDDFVDAAGVRGGDLFGDGAAKTDFLRPLTTGWQDLIGDFDGGDHGGTPTPRVLGKETAEITVAFENSIASPKVNKYRFLKDSDEWHIDTLTFDIVDNINARAYATIQQPLVNPPDTEHYVRVHCFADGNDRTRPITLKVAKAKDYLKEP